MMLTAQKVLVTTSIGRPVLPLISYSEGNVMMRCIAMEGKGSYPLPRLDVH